MKLGEVGGVAWQGVDPTPCLSSTLATGAGAPTATNLSPLLLVAAALAAGYYFLS
jgi:hypothetical protein